ncbi:LysR family transcriptional regulator [Marinomonas sp. 2405UD68-3]|uniref:LysR family transcriptional regulator n=1 Tax=Marinomonas sp. 2405UD68-3 TaxID=3391835 RepID=UPI0039C93AE6
MNIKQIRAFVTIARTLSFAEAANILHLSQPTLSLTIKNLEESLGGRLLSRTTRTIALTPEGDALLPIAKQLLAQWDNAQEEIHQRFSLKKGKIAIAAMPSFAASLLPEGLVNYHKKYPKIKIEVHDVLADTVVDMVRQGRLEIGISFDPGNSEDLSFKPLFKDRFIAVIPENHDLKDALQVSWRHLLKDDFITLQRPSSLRQLIEETLEKNDLTLSVAYDAHQLATVGRMVATGLGVAVVPALCEQQMREQGAHCLPVVEPMIERDIGIITRSRTQLSTAAVTMIDVLIRTFELKRGDR